MQEFFNEAGIMAIGSRLRMLTDVLTRDAAGIYLLYGVELNPKWFPVFHALSGQESMTVTALAAYIGHSHPSVSKITAEMRKAGLIEAVSDETDGRRTRLQLSEKGRELTHRIADQYADVGEAIGQLIEQSRHNLWEALAEWEVLLGKKTLLQRVREIRKDREAAKIEIINYRPEHREAFRALNEAWISRYFKIEDADRKALGDPEGYILARGGHISVACYDGQPVGVCALIAMDDPEYMFELAKMAVAPAAQGKNIGYLLGRSVLEKARTLGARKIYLESNTLLKPAISLYRKLGFTEITGRPTPYARCDIQMEYVFD